MTTPAFVPQDSTTFTPIRYFTAMDPYYYTVDNRPLTDIETNLHSVGQGGGDAARRAHLLESIANASSHADAYTSVGHTTGFSGLPVTQLSSSSVQIGPGAIYDTRNINTTNTQQIVKTAILTGSPIFNITAPITVGTSLVYTIEGTFLDINATTMPTSGLPYVDASNTFLPSTLMCGELQLYLNATGTPATTGSQVAPTTTPGNYPLYNITMTQGSATYTVTLHPNAPLRKGLHRTITPIPVSPTGTAVINTYMTAYTMAHSASSSLALPLDITENNLNPYAPIKALVTFAPATASGNMVFNLVYKGFVAGEADTDAFISSSNDVVAVTSGANGFQTFNTVNAIIPNTAFAGFVGGVWTINTAYLAVALQRLGSNGSDTNTGIANIISVVLYQ